LELGRIIERTCGIERTGHRNWNADLLAQGVEIDDAKEQVSG
jgi:hypothetical protein